MLFFEALLKSVQLSFPLQAFDRGDSAPLSLDRKHGARFHGYPVE
jgi:hypothetical protein